MPSELCNKHMTNISLTNAGVLCHCRRLKPFSTKRRSEKMKLTNSKHLILIDDDKDLLELLAGVLKQKGYDITAFENAEEVLTLIEKKELHPDAVICDLKLPLMSGVEFIKRMKKTKKSLPIILMTGEGSVEVAVEAINAGAYDFVLKPLHMPQLLISVQRALYLNQVQQENMNLKSFLHDQDYLGLKGVIGRSPGFRNAMDLAKRVANSRANILINGESGAGKEVIAKSIHELGDRRTGPFVAINCTAIPDNLLESELFGYVKGSFTGAINNKIGLFEEANKGTLFLDEIGDLPLSLQAKLLRVLQERKIKRIGENQTREISARIICATHKDLKKEVEQGRFREDLYFRLNVIPILMPPLRERKEDILPLAEYFLKKFSLMNNVSIKGFTKSAIAHLETLPLKGNVRELENAIERAVVLTKSDYIQVEDLPDLPLMSTEILKEKKQENSFFSINKIMPLEELSKKYIECVFQHNHFAKEQTAKELGIDRKTLYRKLKEMDAPFIEGH
jgi:two-component system response regulator HydG